MGRCHFQIASCNCTHRNDRKGCPGAIVWGGETKAKHLYKLDKGVKKTESNYAEREHILDQLGVTAVGASSQKREKLTALRQSLLATDEAGRYTAAIYWCICHVREENRRQNTKGQWSCPVTDPESGQKIILLAPKESDWLSPTKSTPAKAKNATLKEKQQEERIIEGAEQILDLKEEVRTLKRSTSLSDSEKLVIAKKEIEDLQARLQIASNHAAASQTKIYSLLESNKELRRLMEDIGEIYMDLRATMRQLELEAAEKGESLALNLETVQAICMDAKVSEMICAQSFLHYIAI
jgi:hypothetical protein